MIDYEIELKAAQDILTQEITEAQKKYQIRVQNIIKLKSDQMQKESIVKLKSDRERQGMPL